jgi:hypothetical protein
MAIRRWERSDTGEKKVVTKTEISTLLAVQIRK